VGSSAILFRETRPTEHSWKKEWAEFDAELKPLKVPFFFVPGNHDINNDVILNRYRSPSVQFSSDETEKRSFAG
jgi:hypothetical protein